MTDWIKEMSRGMRKFVLAACTIVMIMLIAWALLAVWARPGRLDESECRDLVRRAWRAFHEDEAVGVRLVEYRLGRYRHRAPVKWPALGPFDGPADRLKALFPQQEPDEGFLDRMKVSHRGRARVAGRTCERLRLSPSEYSGQSIELWIDAETGYPLARRRLDVDGRFVGGYRYRRVEVRPSEKSPLVGEEAVADTDGLIGLAEDELIPPDRVKEMAKRGELAYPRWLPAGFELRGGRSVATLERLRELRGSIRGDLAGGLRRGPGPMQGAVQEGGRRFQTVFSDGLNTISVVQFAARPWPGEGPMDPARAQAVIEQKSREIGRVFHTAMAGRMEPGALVLVFGEVAPEVLQEVAESLEMPRKEPGPTVPPGPGFRPEGPRPPGAGPRGPFGPPGYGPRGEESPPEGPGDPE